MTATITKRADELKPGDVVTLGVNGKCSFLYAERKTHEDMVRMEFGMHSGRGMVVLQLDPAHDTTFRVESPALSSAQQHAEELLDLMRQAAPRMASDLHDPMMALLAKIDPPAPPTLEEALESLAQAVEGLDQFDQPDRHKQAHDILDRARRSGVKF